MKRKEHVDGLKHCLPCNSWLSPDDYHKNSRKWDGLHAYCRRCMSASGQRRYVRERPRLLEDARVWRLANPEKRKAIALRFKFGLEIEDYNKLMAEQEGRCAICRRLKPLHVDHCHSTKRVRGLLCMACNTAIGALGDDPDRIRAAALYVERNK